jgi:hypothetical protein
MANSSREANSKYLSVAYYTLFASLDTGSKRRLYESGDVSEAMSFERSGSDNEAISTFDEPTRALLGQRKC